MKALLYTCVLGFIFISYGSKIYSQTNVNYWTEINLYSAHELSENNTYIIKNMDEGYGEPSTFDDLFNEIDLEEMFIVKYYEMLYENKVPQNITYSDTTGIFRMVHNERVENKLKPLVENEFFIYGTKGMDIYKIDKVTFALDECKTNFFAFSVGSFNKEKFGSPILASEKKLDIVYGNNYNDIEKKINEYYKEMESDYKDNIPVKVYANAGNYFFSYNDDFNWNKKWGDSDPQCMFPDRAIFYLDDEGNIELVWYDELDLYGIPCD